MRKYKVISTDGHFEGPVDWSKWVPEKYKAAVPKPVTRDDGKQAWRTDYDGVQSENVIGSTIYCGMRYDEFNPQSAATYYNADGSFRSGCGPAAQRLREQDEDGIDAEVLYFGGGLGGAASRFKDMDANLALVQAYNNHLADYCSIAPDRLIPNCVVPVSSIDDAIKELERCRNMGFITVCLNMWPNGSGSPEPEDDKFWAAAVEMGMRVSPHVSFGNGTPPGGLVGVNPARSMAGWWGGASGPGRPQTTMGQLIYSGVFDRYPDFKVYFAETQAGWLASHLDYTDEYWQRWYTFFDMKLTKQPSQYVRDHMMFSFIHDRLAMKFRHYVGVDILMWGSDFPHSVGTFPESRMIIDELFEDVPENERRKVLVENPCEFFGLDPDKAITETPGTPVAAGR